jgi:SAM-dependent methyltransferase
VKAPERCPICGCAKHVYEFSTNGRQIGQCPDCGLMSLQAQPLGAPPLAGRERDGGVEPAGHGAAEPAGLAALHLRQLQGYHGPGRGRLLGVGPGLSGLGDAARAEGWDFLAVEPDTEGLGSALAGLASGGFDAVALVNTVAGVRDPVALLERIRALLKPGGTLYLVTPSLDSFAARLLRQNWGGFKGGDLFYFDSQTLQKALARAGFQGVELNPAVNVPAEYGDRRLERFPLPVLTPLARLGYRLFPQALKRLHRRLSDGSVNALAKPAPARPRPLVSIIVPVYNEAATFPVLMDALLKKELPDLDREILLVESNSTDGTRAIVMGYEGTPGVRVVLEERPRGKGHAVRTGLAEAGGDIVLIQDGDLEYDLNDYDQLLEPLARCQSLVVLGSRHSGDWKIRRFTGQPVVSSVLNLAHVFFAFLLNTACGSSLRDPFTMYKVFRRDCVHGLHFKADRFDFDWELVIKLLRKGYLPLEIPVNYTSRSFQEGKKVRLFRDPLNWIWALVRFRLGPL